MKTPLLAAAVLWGLAIPARLSAIELSLEENKAERGNIGFVDTQRLFKLFPETLKAKENFEEAVRQAEDQVNARKAEILRLRKELDALKVERESLARSTPTVVAPPAAPAPAAPAAPAKAAAAPPPVPAPAVSASTAAAMARAPNPPAPAPGVSTSPVASAAIAQLPGFGAARPAVSTAAAAQPLVINLPGATTGPVVVSPPTAPAAEDPYQAALTKLKAQETAPAPPAPVAPAPAPPPSAPGLVLVPASSSATARAALDAELATLDAKVADKARELERLQAKAKDEQAAAEKDLLDLESRKSEILLGKIYKAVQEVARREGVSVVVDKSGILYGHNAVDLTDKVLRYLKGG